MIWVQNYDKFRKFAHKFHPMSSLVELLSPAKNLECGIEAVNHGADAIYIGAARYGARVDAGNSLADIAQLVRYAHLYGAKVFVTLNTILTDKELEEAETMIRDLYNVGVDALIVQDMGILQLSLPPIELHASTQTDNRTPEKVRFLQEVGFRRVVLARELSLDEITAIHQATSVELEGFVHGALCVSYSGQCYMSAAATGRSANRGCCAQYCRLPYSLYDATGRKLVADKHLLSLKDMDRSDYLQEMIEAGVTSFKIEGRLKEVEYVKNITAYYRQRLDAILDGKSNWQRASYGKSTFFFTPNPEKTFHRGKTDYFLHGKRGDMACFDTPKSVGEYVGKVTKLRPDSFEVDGSQELHNGDGLCFVAPVSGMTGFRVNSVEGRLVKPAQMPEQLSVGTDVYRNYDHLFMRLLAGKSAERKIGVKMLLQETPQGFSLTLTAAQKSVTQELICDKQFAQQPEKALDTLKTTLLKVGNTPFEVENIDIQLSNAWFLPNSQVADLRRRATDALEELLSQPHLSPDVQLPSDSTAIYPEKTLTYLGNVLNSQAADFYRQHGVVKVLPAYEQKPVPGAVLMFCKHCIRYALGHCRKQQPASDDNWQEPSILQYKDRRFQLEFDCRQCVMLVKSL